MERFAKIGKLSAFNYFLKTLHLRCLKGFWIRLCITKRLKNYLSLKSILFGLRPHGSIKLTLVKLNTYNFTRMMELTRVGSLYFCLEDVKDGLKLRDVHTKCKLPVKDSGLQISLIIIVPLINWFQVFEFNSLNTSFSLT